MFSPSTLNLFKQLLGQTSISAGAPDFEEIASTISLARRELAAALDGVGETAPLNGLAEVR